MRRRSSSTSSACCLSALTYSSSFALSCSWNSRMSESFDAMICPHASFCASISLCSSCGMFWSRSSAQRISTAAFCLPERTASSCSRCSRSWRCFSSATRRWPSRQSAATRMCVMFSMPPLFFLSRCARLSAICCCPFERRTSSCAPPRPALLPASLSSDALRASTRACRTRLRSSLSGMFVLYSSFAVEAMAPRTRREERALRAPVIRAAALAQNLRERPRSS